MTSEINVSFRTFLLFSVRLFQRVGPLTHSQRCFLASIVEWLTKLWLKTLNVTNNDRVEIRVNPSVWTQSGPPCCPGVLTGTDRIYYTSIQPIYQRTSHFRQPLAVSTTSLITPTIAASKRVTLWDTLTAGQTDVWLSGLGPKRSSHPQETEAETERWKITMFQLAALSLSRTSWADALILQSCCTGEQRIWSIINLNPSGKLVLWESLQLGGASIIGEITSLYIHVHMSLLKLTFLQASGVHIYWFTWKKFRRKMS